MKYICYVFLISLLLFIISVMLFGCDPFVIAPEPVEVFLPQFDPNWVNSQKEYDEWVNSLDPNFVEESGL